MRVRIDREADAAYIRLGEGEIQDTREVDEGVILDLDAGGKVLGIEVLYLSTRGEGEQPGNLTLEAG